MSAPSPPKTDSVGSIPDAEVPKPKGNTEKRQMSDKTKEEADAIAKLMAEQEKHAKSKPPQKDSETCGQQMKELLGKPNTLNEKQKEDKKLCPKDGKCGANQEKI